VPLDIVRFTAFAVFVLAGLVAWGGWAVRTRQVRPSSRLGRALRGVTDPILGPIEHRLVRGGGNPQNAGWWLFGGAVVGGIVVITLAQWLTGFVGAMAAASGGGGRSTARILVDLAFRVVTVALIARVIGSWFGVGRYHRWLRPAYWLTDWIVAPLRRAIPQFGMFDIAPFVAYFVLLIARGWIVSLL